MTWRLGVDIGGTFTDFALFDESGSEIAMLKRLTTPADPSIAVIEGTAALLRREDVPIAEVETIAHGTTLVTNAVIERRGAKTGMLVTAGFRDILDMGFEQRYDLFDLRLTGPTRSHQGACAGRSRSGWATTDRCSRPWTSRAPGRRCATSSKWPASRRSQSEMRLDAHATRAAIEAHVARPAGLDPIRAAWGVHEIANEDVARAFRIHASERGFDYRRSSMVAFGGSGPVHALAIARKLRIPRVIFPIGAGVMSALGLLVSPLGFEVSRSRRVSLADLDAASFEGFIAPLVEEASGFLHRAGIADPHISTRLDMRYQGQGYEIEVTLPEGGIGAGTGYAEVFARLDELFRARYAEIFAETFLDEPLEIVSWKVEAAGEEAALTYASIAGGARAREKRPRNVWFGDAFVECEVLDRYALEVGTVIEGPAVIEERESTCVLGPGDRATVDAHLNLVAELANEESDS